MAGTPAPPTASNDGVFTVGLNYKKGNLSIGAIDYYSEDIINIFYTEGKYSLPRRRPQASTSRCSTPTRTSVATSCSRAPTSIPTCGASRANWPGAAPCSRRLHRGRRQRQHAEPLERLPGYTSVQVEDFNRDGEDAWMLRAGYKFKAFKGPSVYGLYVEKYGARQ